MELMTLDSNYQPAELVERTDSLIWTERYSKEGDFTLTSTDVERMVNLLPTESMVTIRESTVPMVVEVHKIEKKARSSPMVTITGRSFERVLERRAAVKFSTGTLGGARVAWVERRAKRSDAAYQAIRKIIGDVARPSVPLLAQAPTLSPNDAFEMVDLIVPADYVAVETTENPFTDFEIKPGNLYTTAIELITAGRRGLKAVRPAPGENKIGIEIYNGANLRDEVVFDARFDQFENSTYLLSKAASTNWGYVSSKSASQTVSKTTSPEPSGLERRVLYLDLSGQEGTDSEESRRTRGLVELYKFNATALFDGQLAEQVATGYNRDYFLGDILRLDGEYGLSENVRVAEFIRSDDKTGSKAYPTFEAVSAV